MLYLTCYFLYDL